MNILVTGATGFIGHILVESLIKEGHEVTVLSRPGSQVSGLKQLKLNLSLASFDDLESLEKITRNKEIIFHLAGLINADSEAIRLYRQANVLPTSNLLKTADRAVLKSFVYCSTVGVYGRLDKLPADENTLPHPDNLYGQSKLEAEQICLDFYKNEDLPVVITRPSWVYGPGDKRTFKFFKAIDSGFFRIIGDGKISVHPVFVYDLVEALKLCAFKEKARGEIFIIGGNEVLELNELVSMTARVLNKPVPGQHIPLFLAEAGAALMEKPFGLLGKKPPLSRRRLEFFTRSHHYDISKSKRELSFEPGYSLADGLKITVGWYKKEGWL